MAKNNNKNKTTKHTIEFSNNTLPGRATSPAVLAACSLHGRRETPPKWMSLWDAAALSGLAGSQRLD
jgi:hypothetical protein